MLWILSFHLLSPKEWGRRDIVQLSQEPCLFYPCPFDTQQCKLRKKALLLHLKTCKQPQIWLFWPGYFGVFGSNRKLIIYSKSNKEQWAEQWSKFLVEVWCWVLLHLEQSPPGSSPHSVAHNMAVRFLRMSDLRTDGSCDIHYKLILEVTKLHAVF